MAGRKKKILVFVERYLPGYKSGGPIRSISNLVSWLGKEYEFKIITTDRDKFEVEPYADIKVNEWNKVGEADIYYMGKDSIGIRHIYKVIKTTDYDAVYLNSFFHLWFSTIPFFLLIYIFGSNPQKILLAPRGELSDGALGIKSIKKKFFLWFSRVLGIYKKIKWHATNNIEKREIIDQINITDREILTASNLPQTMFDTPVKKIEKEPNKLKIIYLSRITPKKNLNFILSVLAKIKTAKVTLDIYGIVDDHNYWTKCQYLIKDLPSNIEVNYKGVIKHEKVVLTIAHYHLFLLPTKGENFGHAIYEAMIAGTPVLISDKTPWRNLQKKKLGWDIALAHKEQFIDVIEDLGKMNQKEINQQKEGVRANILKLDIDEAVSKTKNMFNWLT